MNGTIDDLNFIEEDDDLYSDSINYDGAIVDNDDWDDQVSDNDNVNREDDMLIDEDISLEELQFSQSNSKSEHTDLIESLLRSRGINDSSKIKFENESGDIEEKDWNDLSVEEQMNIISGSGETTDTSQYDLDDNEIDLINRIRLSRMSVQDYINYEVQKGISHYANHLENQTAPSYVVDDLSDEELYVLDLQTKIEDITDEELLQALDIATSNPELFTKQMAGLRNEYKELEENKIAKEQAIRELNEQERFIQFSNNVINSIENFRNIGDLDINMEDLDANELYQFITGTDPAGINYFAKALNDPDTLTRVAWFALHGEDVFNSISDYYNNVIAQVSKNSYEKGRQSVKQSKSQPEVVINPIKQNKRNGRKSTIYDLD